MVKRYQVFVSSTYEDLQEERQHVIQALLELDCMPAGMELFPAANQDQWTLIKNVIDDCDYYVVIIGGRYGSVGPDGLSYTEMEYRYALDVGKPVLAFIHKDPMSLRASRVDADSGMQAKLREFRTFVQRKMCRFWSSPPELGGLVSRAVVALIKHSPSSGWVKASELPGGDPVGELRDLRKRLEEAEAKAKDVVDGASNVGLVRAFRRQGDYGTESEWLALLGSSIERVDMMGRALYGWAQSAQTRDVILRKIRDEQVTFRMLIIAPTNAVL